MSCSFFMCLCHFQWIYKPLRRAPLFFLYFFPFDARVGGEEWIRKNVSFYLWDYSIIGQRFFS